MTKSHPPAPRQAPRDDDGADDDEDAEEDDDADEEQDDNDAQPDYAPNGNFAPPRPKEPAQTPSPDGNDEQQGQEEPLPKAASPAKESSPRPVQRGAPTTRHIQDLETKLKMFERRREEDKEKLLNLEKMQTEKERLESIVQKLQSKLQPQSQELTELRKQLKESKAKAEEIEASHGDNDTALEEAYLDKEMAEELAEAAKAELDAVKQRLEEVQLEVEVLREENSELGADMSPEERSSQGWLQMERSNERLREALVRLRDMTQDTEAELREEISSLEDDLKQLSGIKEQHDDAKEKLKASEAAVESLKEQLDDALGSEQTIEEFATQNDSLKEQIDELKITIQDLEDLKNLNDELEVNHIEAEKQLQDELDYKDSLISDHRRLAVDQQERIVDHEYTLTKFRELVTNLQSHLEDMKASQQLSEAEAEELSSRSKAMTDLNMKLQNSAARTQTNVVDLELRRLDASEAVEHLAIVQMFLPESYQSEKNSVLAYLRFIRLAAKSRILHQMLKTRLSSDSASIASEDVFALCDILDKLAFMAAICDRFVSRISGSSIEEFSRFEAALHELDPVERGLNGYIDAAKKDDLRAATVAEELQRTEALLTHLAEVHIQGDNLADYTENVLMRTTLMQSYLENTASVMALVNLIAAPKGIQDLDEDDSVAVFVSNANGMVAQSRSAKVVAGKALQALQDLKARSMSISTDNSGLFEECQEACSDLAGLTRRLGEHLRRAVNSEETSEENPVSSIVRTALGSFCSQHLPDTTSNNPIAVFTTRLRSISSQLSHILDVTSSLSNTLEFSRPEPPWAQRATQLKNSKQMSQSVEAELARMKDSLSAQSQQLRARDQTIEEATVKIELLESRTKDANSKASRISELSRAVEAGKARERDLAVAIESHARDLSTLSAERDRWAKLADERSKHAGRAGTAAGAQRGPSGDESQQGNQDEQRPSAGDGAARSASAREAAALAAELAGLQSAVRFLRNDNRAARLAHPSEPHMAWLRTPLGGAAAASVNAAQPAEHARAALARDGRDVLARLSEVALAGHVVDLTPLDGKEDRLRWRPAREKSAWALASARATWRSAQATGAGVVARGRDMLRGGRPTFRERELVGVGSDGGLDGEHEVQDAAALEKQPFFAEGAGPVPMNGHAVVGGAMHPRREELAPGIGAGVVEGIS